MSATNGHEINHGVINHGVDLNSGSGHGTYKSYIIGFILSIILTVVPYMIVVHKLLPHDSMIIAVVIIGIMQLLVQLIFFLHLGGESKPRWNLMAFLFTLLVVIILVVGTMWIMYNLDYNMMEHSYP